MKKQTKIVAVASAAALLAVGASMTSFAAAGWVEEDGQWYYYDADGNRVEDEWKKSGDNWYWLDSEENGAMAIDKLIDDDDDTYYVDSNGAMVRNTWVKVVNDEQDDDDDPAEYNYYYMQSNGKAYKNTGDSVSKKTIDGKRYAFDEDGKMLYGWVSDDGSMQNDDDGWQSATYYFGSWEDGSLKTGWQKITVHDETDEKDDDYDYWFNFKSNGKKRTHSDSNDTWKSGSKRYHFNEYGVMVYEWFETGASASGSSAASASNWSYFNSPEDGAKVVKGWFKVAPPTEDNSFLETDDTFATSDSSDESERWYYNTGYDEGLAAGEIKKIKGKYYGFWPDDGEKGGRMLVGLCALTVDETDGSQIIDVISNDMDGDDLDDFLDDVEDGNVAENTYLYYFGDSDDADTDGALKTGSTTINLDGDSYNFLFKKSGGAESKGRGENGIDDSKYIYQYGLKVKADSEEKYIAVEASTKSGNYADKGEDDVYVKDYDSSDIRNLSADSSLKEGEFTNKDGDTVKVIYNFPTDWYLLNTAGRIQDGKKSGVKDGDDWYWYTNKNGYIVMYTNNKTLKTEESTDAGAELNDEWDSDSTETASAKIGDLLK